MSMLKIAALSAALFASGCASSAGMSWQRMDGRPISAGAFERAISECRSRAGGRDEAVMQRCMASRGYVWAQAAAY
jgi:hypothetical protein